MGKLKSGKESEVRANALFLGRALKKMEEGELARQKESKVIPIFVPLAFLLTGAVEWVYGAVE